MNKEQIGETTLYCGDCLDILPSLGKVDAVVTDPPYGVIDEVWDDMSKKELAAFTMQWMGAAYAVSDNSIYFFGEKTRHVINSLLYLLYDDVRQCIWNKGGGVQADHGYFYSYESFYICQKLKLEQVVVTAKSMRLANAIKKGREDIGLSKGGVDIATRGKKTGLCYRWEEGCCIPTDEQVEILNKTIVLGDEFYTALDEAKKEKERVVSLNQQRTVEAAAKETDVLNISTPTKKRHPTEKPVLLMEKIIKAQKAQSILDPFMGSGTTGVACANLGRKFIGIEIEPKYFDIACERITAAYAQGRLFA